MRFRLKRPTGRIWRGTPAVALLVALSLARPALGDPAVRLAATHIAVSPEPAGGAVVRIDFNSAPTYRYYRGGSYYNVNRYAADLLRQAINYGYREGIRAGRADRMDRWRFDYRNAFAYQDANYGYRGFYVTRSEYNYDFRQGFRRGYEDGYYGRRQYGRYSNGNDAILGNVLSLILNLQPYNRY